jgi:hypothetical protein
MGKFVHLAREFFNEGEMRDLLSGESFFPITALYNLARARGVLLPEGLSREEVVNELSRYWYSWRQFQSIAKQLDTGDRDEKSAVVRINNDVAFDEVQAANELLVAKRTESKRERYTLQKISDTKVRIVATYIERDPTRAKGLQREEKTSTIDIDLGSGRAEVFHGRDDRSSEIAYQLVSCLREARKNPEDDLIEDSISLRHVTDAAGRTEFFTRLLEEVEGSVLLKVKDVRLEHFRAEADDEAEREPKEGGDELEALEEEAAGQLESAVLHGNNVLGTTFFEELREKEYFISYLRWEIREKGGSERRVILEAGFRDAQKGEQFYFDAKKYYEKDDLGDDRAVAKATKLLDRVRFRKLIADAAFRAVPKTADGAEQDPA